MMASDVTDANEQTLGQAADMFDAPPSHDLYDVTT